MILYLPYVLAAVFAAISAAKGNNWRVKGFGCEIGISCTLMLIVRDILFLFGVV